jgi:hypothetical protein
VAWPCSIGYRLPGRFRPGYCVRSCGGAKLVNKRIATVALALRLLQRRQLLRLAEQTAGATLLGAPSLVVSHDLKLSAGTWLSARATRLLVVLDVGSRQRAILSHWPAADSSISDVQIAENADERTRTSTGLPRHGPEPCASTNSATSACGCEDSADETCGRDMRRPGAGGSAPRSGGRGSACATTRVRALLASGPTDLAPLSSRGLGRRPLMAETRVRIPVAVLAPATCPRGRCVQGCLSLSACWRASSPRR